MSEPPTSASGADDPAPPPGAGASSVSAAWVRHRVSRRETRKATFVSGFVMFACKKVAPLRREDGGVHEHDVDEQPHPAVQA